MADYSQWCAENSTARLVRIAALITTQMIMGNPMSENDYEHLAQILNELDKRGSTPPTRNLHNMSQADYQAGFARGYTAGFRSGRRAVDGEAYQRGYNNGLAVKWDYFNGDREELPNG